MSKKTIKKSEAADKGPADVISMVLGDDFGNAKRLTDAERTKFPAVPSGISAIDKYLHGGLAVGTLTEVSGPPGSGKSTLVDLFMGSMCRMSQGDAMFLLVDTEHGYDAPYAARYGVVNDRVIRITPRYGEEAMQQMYLWARNVALLRRGLDPRKPTKFETITKGNKKVPYAVEWARNETYPDGWDGMAAIFVDSVARLVPKTAWQRQQIGDESPPPVAEMGRMMSDKIRMFPDVIADGAIAMLMTNQERAANIGTPGPQKAQPGGNALPFYASNRWVTGKRGKITVGEEEIGRYHSLKVVKSRNFSIYRQELLIPYTERGIDFGIMCFDSALQLGLLAKNGSWYTFQNCGEPLDGIKFQGLNGFSTMMDDPASPVTVEAVSAAIMRA